MKKRILPLIFTAVCSSMFFSSCVETADRITYEQKEIPESFSLINEQRITSPKKTGDIQSNWAFSVISTVESNIITNGFSSADNINLSEAHLYNYLYDFEEDRKFYEKNEGYYILASKKNGEAIYNTNGNSVKSAEIFANGAGPENETNLPLYVDNISGMAEVVSFLERSNVTSQFGGDYLLTEFCNYENAGNDDIKRGIMNNGAMYFEFYSDDKYFNNIKDISTLKAYFQSNPCSKQMANQSAVIIGWDDNFSRENFKKGNNLPDNNGAWLVQNSSSDNDAQNIPFWLSYEDTSITEKTFFNFTTRQKSDLVLYYDSIGYHDSIKTEGKSTKIANIFHGENGKMILVGLYTLCDDQKVRIRVYKNPKPNKPDSGQLVSDVERTIRWKGYHTIDIESDFNITQQDNFSIVAEFMSDENSDSEHGLAPIEGGGYISSGINMVLSSSKGESYIYINDNWYDMSEKNTADMLNKQNVLNNACIKAVLKSNSD